MIKVELHAVAIDDAEDVSTFRNMVDLVEKNILDLCKKSEVHNFEVIFYTRFCEKDRLYRGIWFELLSELQSKIGDSKTNTDLQIDRRAELPLLKSRLK